MVGIEEMNKIVREVFGNQNRQNRSALTADQVRTYVDDVVAHFADYPQKSIVFEFLLKLLVFG